MGKKKFNKEWNPKYIPLPSGDAECLYEKAMKASADICNYITNAGKIVIDEKYATDSFVFSTDKIEFLTPHDCIKKKTKKVD